MSDAHSPLQNRLLAALPAADYERLTTNLELVQMPFGVLIHESDHSLHHVFFPTSAIVSLQNATEDGSSIEIVKVGNEGMIGVVAVTGGVCMLGRATVLFSGHAYRMPSRVLRHELNRSIDSTGALHRLLMLYTQARITQIAQSVVCIRHHSMEKRLCRWLLSSLDRSSSAELAITQEVISGALGVRREGITEAIGRLRRAGFIGAQRGHVSVLDRAGLEAQACECYQIIKKEFDRLLPDTLASQAATPRYRSVGRTLSSGVTTVA